MERRQRAPPLHPLEQHLAFAKEFARHAGAVIRENWRLGLQKEWKEDRTPVTDTDELINRDLVRAVKQSYPTFAVKGEEEDYFVDHPDMTWVCDPLDGTFPFTSVLLHQQLVDLVNRR
jgi:fructose-1,6-bisphosphatase/inositol monophosphatase family enzyme